MSTRSTSPQTTAPVGTTASTTSTTPTSATSVPAATGTVNTVPRQEKNAFVQFLQIAFYILGMPVTLPICIASYGCTYTKNITVVLYNQVRKIGSFGINMGELVLLVAKSLNILIFGDGNTRTIYPRIIDLYNRMVDTLTDLRALPSTKEFGALMHLMLSRLPQSLWETILPYPHPFFRGSVTKVSKTQTNKLIMSTGMVPHDRYSSPHVPVNVVAAETAPTPAVASTTTSAVAVASTFTSASASASASTSAPAPAPAAEEEKQKVN